MSRTISIGRSRNAPRARARRCPTFLNELPRLGRRPSPQQSLERIRGRRPGRAANGRADSSRARRAVLILVASTVAALLLGRPAGKAVGSQSPRTTSTCALPTCSTSRSSALCEGRRLGERDPRARIAEAVADLLDLPVERYSHEPLVPRIWQLRDNFSSYDATYLALAETLATDAIPILTADTDSRIPSRYTPFPLILVGRTRAAPSVLASQRLEASDVRHDVNGRYFRKNFAHGRMTTIRRMRSECVRFSIRGLQRQRPRPRTSRRSPDPLSP